MSKQGTTAGRTWWKEAVAYQIYPRSFMDSNGDGVGDLNGITSRLDYLQSLGVDLLWICPIFKSPNDDNGYDVSDYDAILDEFGTMDDFERLLAEVHRRGMRLILDLVANHTSDEHPWFLESRSSRDNPKRDWYIWRDGRDGREPNNWESIFKGSAWKYDDTTGQYFLHLFSERQPDLNWDNPELREAIYTMVRGWLDKGVDGFRLDATSHKKKAPGLPDMPNPHGLDYVPSFANHMNVDGVLDYVDELCRNTFAHYDVVAVGEANGVSADQARYWVGDEHERLDMIFQFEHSALWKRDPRGALDVVALKRVLTKWQKALDGVGWNALFLENHDLPRIVSRWGDTGQWWRESATALATMYFLMQGTPFIYQGQELGATNSRFDRLGDFDDVLTKNRHAQMQRQGMPEHEIIETLAILSRDNSRTPMQWDASPNAGFTTGSPWLKVNPNFPSINVAQQQDDPASVLTFYRRLIRLRKSEPTLIHGHYELLMEDDPQVYAYLRVDDTQRFVIITNLTRNDATYAHPGFRLHHEDLLLANRSVDAHEPAARLTLRAYEARVYRL